MACVAAGPNTNNRGRFERVTPVRIFSRLGDPLSALDHPDEIQRAASVLLTSTGCGWGCISKRVLPCRSEALHNVFKHAGATRVSVFLGRRRPNVVLMIENDGCGFDPTTIEPSQTNGFRVVRMRERATLLGGHLETEASSGHGTTVIVRAPLLDNTDGEPHVA